MRIAGFSNLIARLPSITAWVLTAAAMVRIGRRIGLQTITTAVLVTAVTPMLFRYAIEGRPYLPAFCLTAYATLLLLRFADERESRPDVWLLGLYGVLLTAAPLFQGSAITVTVAHALFVLTGRALHRDRRRQAMIITALLASLILPIAWSLYMRHAWAQAIVHDGYRFDFTLRTVSGFLKDISDAGPIGTGLLVIAAVAGYARIDLSRSGMRLLGLIVLTTICGALVLDAIAGYFTSPRQAIYCLCGLIVLAAAGLERFQRRHALPAALALLVFIGIALAKDFRIVRSKEDWKAASKMLTASVTEGFCVKPVSNLTAPLDLYSFFDASLEAHRCGSEERKIGLVHSIFTPRPDTDAAAAALLHAGFVASGTEAAGGTTLERFILPTGSR